MAVTEFRGEKVKTIFVTITGGYGIRNIFRSDAFKILKSQKDMRIVIFTPFVDGKSIISDFPEVQGGNIIFEDLAMYRPGIPERILKKMAEVVVFNRSRPGTIRIKEMALKRRNRVKYLVTKLVKKIIGKDKNLLTALDNLDLLISRRKSKRYRAPFEKYGPSLVFTTDFLHPYEWSLVKTARRRRVQVISMIANWDHFAKGVFHKCDRAIVWNEFNKKQLIDYYGYSPEVILVAGIPHQDYFVNYRSKFIPKKEILKRIGAAEDKRLVTYATARGSQDEQDILDIICKAIMEGKLKYPSHLHVRIHPEDIPGRYEQLKKYGGIITFELPKKTVSERFWSGKMMLVSAARPEIWVPDDEEMIQYANLLACTDVAVNVASSVTLDNAALDIPTVNIAFDGYAKRDYLDSNARIFEYTHYEFIPKSSGIRVARSPEELIQSINVYLENPKLDSEGRKKIVAEHCGPQDGQCGERIAKFVLDSLPAEKVQ
jgi:hypothetical protein